MKDETPGDTTGSVQTPGDTTGNDKTAGETTGSVQTPGEGTGNDKNAGKPTESVQTPEDTEGNDKTAGETTGNGQTPGDTTGNNKTAGGAAENSQIQKAEITGATEEQLPEEIKALQERINALPDRAALEAMSLEEQKAVNDEIGSLFDLLDTLTEEEAAKLDLDKLMAAAEFMTQQIMPLAPVQNGEIYVSASGSDETGDGTSENPFASLAKAADYINSLNTKGQQYVIYVTSDLEAGACARFYHNHIQIIGKKADGSAPVVTRGDNFELLADNARTWYNPAMIEIGGNPGETAESGAYTLRLDNIILDDAGKKEGTNFVQASTDSTGGNMDIVQDAMIATYNGTGNIILGEGTVLKNFGGMSAVRLAGGKLVMEAKSSILDDTVTDRTKEKNDFGAAGAVWIQGGQLIMQEGSEISGIVGRAVYVDGGSAEINGQITNIKSDKDMWQGTSGVAIHLRNKAKAVLESKAVIQNISNDGSAVSVADSELDMKEGSIIRDLNKMSGIVLGSGKVTMNGEITGMKSGGQALNISGNGDPMECVIGASGNIHDNACSYGAIYIQAPHGKLDIYGKINYNTNNDRAGAIALANNFSGHVVTMYDDAEIIGNSASQTGGAVMVSSGTFIMKGGVISENSTTASPSDGGGVFVRRGGHFIMEGGQITNNKTSAFGVGGGVALEASDWNGRIPKVELLGGTISGNEDRNGANDVAILSTGSGSENRYLMIGPDVTLGVSDIYMSVNGKLVTAVDGDYPIKLENASNASITALTNDAASKGCSAPYATFWMQKDRAAQLKVTKGFDENYPVYALV